MDPRIIFWLCLLLHIRPRNCESNESGIDDGEQLSDFMAQVSHEGLDDSEETVSALKNVVKRLARGVNGQSGFQAVTGQPGVDFPMLTTIPATSFSCRGIKGGYYADLETNCQVFHICDNGRKISFLCPNGTIFQQSQLICDWWFKVDCNKSTELYEQSAEQLAEDERKRADAKRINSEFRRPSNDDNGQKYYRTSKTNYDGKQNGRTNPYGNSARNQLTEIEQRSESNKQTSTRPFDPNQIYSQQNTRTNNQFSQINDLAPVDVISTDDNASDDASTYNESDNTQDNQNYRAPANYQSHDTPRNQLINDRNSAPKQQFNYDQRTTSKYSAQSNRYQDGSNNNRGAEKRNNDRGRKFKTLNLDEDETNDRATPLYTETTTFRTSTASPIKEYQQLAESAAFATARGNRVNKVYGNNHFNYRSNEVSTAASTLQPSTTYKSRIVNSQFSLVSKKDIPAFPHSTFAPIYKPRTTTYEPTTLATSGEVDSTNYSRWDRQEGTTTAEFDQTSTTPYSTVQNLYYKTTNPSSSFTDAITETQEWISTTPNYSDTSATETSYSHEQASSEKFTSQRFSNTQMHNDNTLGNRDYSRASYTTARTFPNSQPTREISANLRTSTESYNRDYSGVTRNFAINNGTSDENLLGTTRPHVKDNRAERNGRNRSNVSRSSMRSWQNFRPNAINPTTEKSTTVSQSIGQQNFANGKTSKPYDTSFTYKQGKIMSTLVPYIPFTKNYAYTTTTSTTTLKSPVYTATVPTYTTPNSQYRGQSSKTFNTIDKVTPTSINGLRRSSTYLPDIKSDISPSKRPNLDQRPAMERQHALNMLQSLRGLAGTVPTIIGNAYGNRSGLKIPLPSSPATLHSLALYFSTAGDTIKTFNDNRDVNQKNTNDSTAFANNGQSSNQNNQSVEFPTSILTQHTINSYADLFNLNNALEVNATVDTDESLTNDDEDDSEEDDSDDLDLQQSEGPLDGAKKSNSTKLRELAKIFTHALSAYLQDPDTFKKILTEIRPTVPSIDDDETSAVTASLPPTTVDDYPSVTKEKDEVLDFSDDVTPSKFKRPTTIIPLTTTEIPTNTDDSGFGYYTTSVPPSESGYQTTTFTPVTENDQYSTQPNNLSNNIASQVNTAFDEFTSNNGHGGTTGHTAPTFNDATVDYENYFPSGESAYNNEVGDIQQNNATTYEPYGKYVKPPDSSPIQYDNYEKSSTPNSYEQTLPPAINENSNRNAFNQLKHEFDESITSTVGENFNVPTLSGEPFKIQYYDQVSTTSEPGRNSGESLVTANSINPNYNNIHNGFNNNYVRNNQAYNTKKTQDSSQPFTPSPSSRYSESSESYTNSNDQSKSTLSQTVSNTNSVDNDSKLNDHWTSSPTVTQLWESTVFYDPKHINQGLTSQTANNPSSFDYFDSVPSATTHSSISGSQEILVTDSANGITSQLGNNKNSPTPWQWSTTETDTPTMFTLLPSSYSSDQTATPTPIYTTRSSITTTITSSITSTSSLPSDRGIKTLDGDANDNNNNSNNKSNNNDDKGASDRENEIIRAKEMFGKLNVTSTDTLMKVMKHADENATVRQLVLLLINHCNGPMNKTKEQEREQLLNALLRTPVNEFTSDESRELIAGISKLNLPIGSADDLEAKSSSHFATSPKPAITTYRNKNSRRVRVNGKTTSTNNRGANSNNRIKSVNETDSTASDERALELLRSLYSVAAKWG